MKISFSPPDITQAEIEAVAEVLRSGWITTGPRVRELEERLAEYCGTPRAVCLNSATACMEMALRAWGIGPGDEVITSAYTYSATAAIICHVGATPILIDTEKNSYHMDIDQIEKAISRKTKAILPVDIGGAMCDYERILEVMEEKKGRFRPQNDQQAIFSRPIILADAAHSFGASRKNKKSGNAADFTAFSFHAVKNLTTGEGGALTWRHRDGINPEEWHRRVKLLSLHGQTKDALEKNKTLSEWEYDVAGAYYKCNMTDVAAAIGLVQFARYEKLLKKRRAIAEYYDKRLSEKEVTAWQRDERHGQSSRHLYLVRLPGRDRESCNNIMRRMAQKGVPSNVHFKPLPLLTAYRGMGFRIENCPNAYDSYSNTITLPLHTGLTGDEAEYVMDVFINESGV
ncbi:MAG: DegT/DnrJ/EryC1/StrS family aminotransferase [Oscillospiraceae bacterium]|nr:DegT/DnrJ/EryC1/StrS family aminotransferase [Oscillospiraceae bacterium]